MFFQNVKNLNLNEGWRYVLGTFIILLIWMILGNIGIFVLYAYAMMNGVPISDDIQGLVSAVGFGNNTFLILIISTFAVGCLAVYLVVRFLHKRPFLSILTSRKRFSWKHMFLGFGIWMLIGLFALGISYAIDPPNYTFSFDLWKFIPLLLISIFLLPIQTTFEEIFIRGYLMQGVGLVTKSKVLALFLPAIFFGLLHSFNPEVSKYGFGIMMSFYIGMGIFLGVLALMDDGLEIPIGVHWANNLLSAVFLTFQDSALQTDALFRMKEYDIVEDLPYFFLQIGIALVIFMLIFRWRHWGRLFKKIQ